MDLNKSIRMAVESGKVLVGTRESKRSIVNGKGKVVILSNNCPKDTQRDIEYYTSLAKIPLIRFKGTSLELGEVCGFPYPVSVMVVLEEGDSDILKFVEGE